MHTAVSYQEFLDTFYALGTDQPELLQAVYEKVADGCREALVLHFTTKSLVFTANADDDTIRVRPADGVPAETSSWTCVTGEEPWSGLLGSAFVWGWITINQQGYCDGALLSFEGIIPNLMLSVIASSLVVHRLVRQREEARALV